MKKIFVFLMIICCSFPLIGCTSARNLSSVNTKFSSLYFVLDTSKANLKNMTSAEESAVKNAIETQASKYLQELKLRYYNALDKQEELGTISTNEKVIYKNHFTPYVNWDGQNYIMELKFYSSISSNIFLQSSENYEIKNVEETFSTKTYVKYSGIFSKTPNNIITSTLENYFSDKIKADLSLVGSESLSKLGEINYYYLFLSENARVHALGTSEIASLGEKTAFCFDSATTDYEFYVVQANALAYYLLALAITFVFISIYLIVIYFKKDKKTDDMIEIS